MMYAQPLLISYVLFLPVVSFSVFAFALSLITTVKQKIKPHFANHAGNPGLSRRYR